VFLQLYSLKVYGAREGTCERKNIGGGLTRSHDLVTIGGRVSNSFPRVSHELLTSCYNPFPQLLNHGNELYFFLSHVHSRVAVAHSKGQP